MKTKYVFFLLLITTLVACKKIKDLTTFEIKNTSAFDVPPNLPAGLLPPVSIPVTNTANQEFKNNNTAADHVQDVRLSKLSLTINSPAGQNFNFLKSVDIYISASGLSEIKLASLDNIPDNNVSTLDLNPTGEKLDDFIKKDTFTLRYVVTTDESITETINISANSVFSVRAKVL